MGLGKLFIVLGAVLLVVGLLVSPGEHLPIKLGRLPGDIVIRGKNNGFLLSGRDVPYR